MKHAWIALLGVALALTSCKLEDSFTATNLHAFVTVKDGTFMDDAGGTCTIVEDLTDKGWMEEGSRHYIIYDILNSNWDVSLREYYRAVIQSPQDGWPEDGWETQPGADPVAFVTHSFSGGYLNMVLQYYYKPGTECPHDMVLFRQEAAVEDELRLLLKHSGNGENPVEMDSANLKVGVRVYSFPLSTKCHTVYLTLPILTKDDTGKQVVQLVSGLLENNSLSSTVVN